jgi:DNA-binding NtrC family response regulator
MFDILAEQIDTSCTLCADDKSDELRSSAANDDAPDEGLPTFRTIGVLMVDTRSDSDSASIIEQCLRYMTGFECRITQAGSHAAAAFALRSDTFDIVITDELSLDLVPDSDTATIVITGRPSSDVTRKALKAGALHCLPLNDLSPRLLETAIAQALSCEP